MSSIETQIHTWMDKHDSVTRAVEGFQICKLNWCRSNWSLSLTKITLFSFTEVCDALVSSGLFQLDLVHSCLKQQFSTDQISESLTFALTQSQRFLKKGGKCDQKCSV